jgi:hypothetical protein
MYLLKYAMLYICTYIIEKITAKILKENKHLSLTAQTFSSLKVIVH